MHLYIYNRCYKQTSFLGTNITLLGLKYVVSTIVEEQRAKQKRRGETFIWSERERMPYHEWMKIVTGKFSHIFVHKLIQEVKTYTAI